ncbi:peptidase M16 [Flavobacterium covae]|uniref:Pitrilysin family protein n=2 Tax=Flavobacterium covae TaxID=2906076 RepID=A0ABW8PD99_9FLAO|nr:MULTISPECIES: pitrilysin family protein [Flavobacterium]OWP82329.1 peptidase M16 [Flavobacterium covae]POR23419.1 peptidase M16 [Flavobacterium columnare]
MNLNLNTPPTTGKLPELYFQEPNRFELSNGLKVLVVKNHKLPRVSIHLQIDRPLFIEGNKKGVDALTSSLLGKGSTKISKEDFYEETDLLGLEFYLHSTGGKAIGLSKYAGRMIELFAQGVLFPNFTQDELEKERLKMIEALRSNEKNVQNILNRIENALIFGSSHPKGEFITENTLKNITLNDIQNNYSNYFTPQNAYLVIIGDIQFELVKEKVISEFSTWSKNNFPIHNIPSPPTIDRTEINWVDLPNAVQTEISIANTVHLPMNSADYFPTLMANQILGGGADGRLFLNLREDKGWTYGAYSSISGSKTVTKFKISTQVRNEIVINAIDEIVKEIQKLRNELVNEMELALVKSKYIGHFIMQSQKPESVARYALNREIQNLSNDFYQNYIQQIDAVQPEDIMRVAQKYFQADHCLIIIVGNGNHIEKQLLQSKYSVKKFDIDCNFLNP